MLATLFECRMEEADGVDAACLVGAIDAMAGAGIAAKASALAIERQHDAADYVADEAVQASFAATHRQAKAHAQHFLDDVLPQLTGAIGNARGMTGLVLGLRHSLLGGAVTADAVPLIRAIVDEAQRYRRLAREFSGAVAADLTRVDLTAATLDGIAQRIIAAADVDGIVAKAADDIAKHNRALTAGIKTLTAERLSRGREPAHLVTRPLLLVENLAPVDTGGERHGVSIGAAAADEAMAMPVARPFQLETIDVACRSPGDLGGTARCVREDADTLARRYGLLFRRHPALTVALAARHQLRRYATMLKHVREQADKVEKCWLQLATAFSDVLCDLQATSDSIDKVRMLSRLAGDLDLAYVRLESTTKRIYISLAGEDGSIPRVGVLQH